MGLRLMGHLYPFPARLGAVNQPLLPVDIHFPGGCLTRGRGQLDGSRGHWGRRGGTPTYVQSSEGMLHEDLGALMFSTSSHMAVGGSREAAIASTVALHAHLWFAWKRQCTHIGQRC